MSYPIWILPHMICLLSSCRLLHQKKRNCGSKTQYSLFLPVILARDSEQDVDRRRRRRAANFMVSSGSSWALPQLHVTIDWSAGGDYCAHSVVAETPRFPSVVLNTVRNMPSPAVFTEGSDPVWGRMWPVSVSCDSSWGEDQLCARGGRGREGEVPEWSRHVEFKTPSEPRSKFDG